MLPARRVVLVAALLWMVSAVTAAGLDPTKRLSQYGRQVWGLEQGLPANGVFSIVQTRDGHIWLGTQEGLIRFDANRFEVFTPDTTPAIGNKDIRGLHEARDGTLWCVTVSGDLIRYDPTGFQAVTVTKGSSRKLFTSLVVDADGAVWIGTSGDGLIRYDAGSSTVLTALDGLASNLVLALATTQDGSLWVGTEEGLSRWNGRSFTTYTTANGLPDDRVTTLLAGPDGRLWVGTQGGLAVVEDGRVRLVVGREQVALILSLARDSHGSLWIGTNGLGLFRWRDSRLERWTTADGLMSNHINTIQEDREKNLWLGTNTTGLVRLNDTRFTTFGTLEGLANDFARPVLETRDGTMWVGTQGGGLTGIRQGVVRHLTTRDGLPSDLVWALGEGRDGALWIGTEAGLARLSKGRITTLTRRDGLPGLIVRSVIEDRRGDLWIGVRNVGVVRFRQGRFTTVLADPRIHWIMEDRNGAVWLASDYRLVRVEGDTVRTFGESDGFPGGLLTTMLEDRDGVVWIGTYGSGIIRYANGRFTSFNTKQGLFDAVAFAVLDDEQGHLWISCNRGIYRVRKADLDRVARGESPTVVSTVFGFDDGLRSTECNGNVQPTGWRARDGRLLFPTMKGLAWIDPRASNSNPVPPPVVIQQVTADDRSLDLSRPLLVEPDTQRLAFHFGVLSYTAPNRVVARYRLEPFDRDWVDAGTRRVVDYTNVPPGRYTFRVIAANNDGVWNRDGASTGLVVDPHFYQTPWFLAVSLLGVVAFVAAVFRVRVRAVARAHAASALQKSERRFRALVEHGSDTIILVDRDGRVAYGSPSAAWQDAETGAALVDLVHPDDRRAAESLLQEALNRPGQVARTTNRLRRRDGTWAYMEGLAVARLDDPAVGAVVVNYRDITDRRSREAAEAASEAKSQFLANMSHEMRTPLNAIVGFAELIKTVREVRHAQRFADVIEAESMALLSIINEILDLAKAEAGRIDIVERPLDMAALLASVQSAMAVTARRKGLQLMFEMDPDVPTRLIGDELRLRQVLTNLVGNGVKFTLKGQVRVEVHVARQGSRPESHPGDASERVLLQFEIVDTGIGIRPEDQRRVFEPFVQADDSDTRRFGGTGLGTTIARRLVSLMGGQIGLESEFGVGTRFWFTVPFRLAPADVVETAAPTAGAADIVSGAGFRILAVDDYGANQVLLRNILESAGYQVDVAENGLEAVLRTEQATYDVILMDVQMPELDGYAATRRIKEGGTANAGVPILALTANAFEADKQKCRDVGMVGVITKPFTRHLLLQTIQTWLHGGASAANPSAQGPASGSRPADGQPARVFDEATLLEELGGNHEMLSCLVETFLGGLPAQIQRIVDLEPGHDLDTLRREAHALRGGAANLRADRLAECATHLESVAREAQIGLCASAVQRLAAEAACLQAHWADRQHVDRPESV